MNESLLFENLLRFMVLLWELKRRILEIVHILVRTANEQLQRVRLLI